MQFQSDNQSFLSWSGDCLALGVFEGALKAEALTGDFANLDQALAGALSDLLQEAEFKGNGSSSAIIRVGRDTAVRKLAVVGLGSPEALQLDDLRRAASTMARLANKAKAKTLGIALPQIAYSEAELVQAIVEGITLGLYQDNRFKSENGQSPSLETIQILGVSHQAETIQKAQAICEGVILARQLVAAPPNTVTALSMAETAQTLSQIQGLELEILEQADCEKLGMGAFLGVAQASDIPPKFLHLTYKPNGTARKTLAIVGKGLTFDSGGLNLKVGASSIEMMKTDMGGAAATLGAAKAIGLLQPDVEVHFISAVTENMISGRALHPGDILTASNGKTIEVNNTDAEGRLTLADALVFAEKLEVDAIVDLATLTGACVVALGNNIAGLWSDNDGLAEQLLQASQHSGEKLWRMPMEEKYFESMKSPVADMKNTGSRAGGAISAAIFLKQFVKETAWAHLDVAGPVWTDKEDGYNPVGATGYGVRLLVDWVTA